MRQILFHSVAISHPKLRRDGIIIEKVSLITGRERNKQVINMRKTKYEASPLYSLLLPKDNYKNLFLKCNALLKYYSSALTSSLIRCLSKEAKNSTG